ncbi:hypothetical protein MTO96_034611 [Rhipicephalus appendiculatus]
MDSVSALVGALTSHMATRIPNVYDSDGATYLAPVASEPVLQLLRPMVTEEDDNHPEIPTCVELTTTPTRPHPHRSRDDRSGSASDKCTCDS